MIIITSPPSINCHPLITTGLSCAPNFLISPVLHALASMEMMTNPSPMKLIPPANPSFVQLTTTMPATLRVETTLFLLKTILPPL